VIDCNRPLHVKSSIVERSEYTVVPGNQNVTPAEAALRARAIFHPYHERIRDELARREREGVGTVFVALHSFTPVFMGVKRPWHAGVLYHRDTRLAHAVIEELRSEGGLVVGDNEPYSVSEHSDYGLIEYGERRGHLHVELEIRQDLIQNDAGQRAWAERLARVLPAACRRAMH
jgi:predicted N-formylglutamate amidohydrolase